jgi:glycosyltransferase involved in cell wall biosynthesis
MTNILSPNVVKSLGALRSSESTLIKESCCQLYYINIIEFSLTIRMVTSSKNTFQPMRRTTQMKNDTVNHGKKPRVLMIAPVFYPYPPVWPEGIVNAKLALAMKNAGWQIDVIVAGYPDGSSRYPSEEGWEELVDNVHIIDEGQSKNVAHRLLNAAQGFVLTGKILQGLDWGLSVLKVVKSLNAKNRYDVILSRAIPDSAHFAALVVHRKTRIPWIANWNDPTPNHKFPPPYGKGPFSPLTPKLDKWYQAVCQHCSWHTFPSERLREYMCSYLPGQIKIKSSVIPHLAMEKFSITATPHVGFSMCYAGSVLPPRDVTVFFEGIRRFRKMLDNADSFCVRFLVDRPEIVAESAKTMGLEEIIKIESTVPYSKMPEILSQSDVLVIIEAPLEEGIFMPSKISDYVQIGRPILALTPTIGTIVDIFSKHGGGIAVDCQSPEHVAQALQKLYVHWKAGMLNNIYSSSALINFLGEGQVLQLYLDLFKKQFIIPA